jgi:hypothetical protein
MTPTEIRVSPRQQWRAALVAAVAMVAFYLYFGYLPYILWVIGIITLIFLLYNLVTRQNKGPVITLDDEGVLDKRLKVGVIHWEDIRRIKSHDLEGALYISLELHDQKSYEARRPLWLKLLSQFQRVHGMSATSISTNGLDIDHETLVDMIHEGCQEASERNVEAAQG